MTRSPAHDEAGAHDARTRLSTIDRDLAEVITDAQSRDWSADRPDRVTFARLGQARHRVRAAAGRRRQERPPADPLAVLLGPVAGLLTTVVLMATGVPATLLPGGAAVPATAPLPLALTATAALWAALAAVAGARRWRRRWDRATVDGPAPVDDPHRYEALRRRIEASAAAAREHRSPHRRAAAIDLEYALDWLAAARGELPRQ